MGKGGRTDRAMIFRQVRLTILRHNTYDGTLEPALGLFGDGGAGISTDEKRNTIGRWTNR